MDADFLDMNSAPEVTGRVLVVDDDSVTRTLLRSALSAQFDVETASSGEQALQICSAHMPDLVLLDVVMPEMDGYETCRRLREFTDIPIIFVTANESLEEHLKAFDAGGEDIITKPVVKEILLRKASIAIQRKNSQLQLKTEKDSMQRMAMNFLSAVGESGVLQKFMQASLTCNALEELAQRLIDALKDFGLECSVLIRDDKFSAILTSHGEASAIEAAILEQASSMGRIFQFKQKLVVNYDHVSVIVNNLSDDDADRVGRMRDNITILTEMTDTLCGNVTMRQGARTMAEQLQVAMGTALFETKSLREMARRTQMDTRLLLQELVDTVEKTYSWLGTSREQETSISKTMLASVERILSLLEKAGGESEEKFTKIQSSLLSSGGDNEVELF